MDKEINLTITTGLQDWADTKLSDYLDDNDVQVDDFDNYFGSSSDTMIALLKEGMENSGIIGFFYDHMDLFKALFIKYPELLTQED